MQCDWHHCRQHRAHLLEILIVDSYVRWLGVIAGHIIPWCTHRKTGWYQYSKSFVIDFMNQGNKWRTYWLPLVLSLLIGLAVGWIDSRKNWDDTGITVFAIFISTLFLGLLNPKGAWLWALMVGGSVVMFNVLRNGNFQSLVALVPSFVGAYAVVGIFLLMKRAEKKG